MLVLKQVIKVLNQRFNRSVKSIIDEVVINNRYIVNVDKQLVKQVKHHLAEVDIKLNDIENVKEVVNNYLVSNLYLGIDY